MAHQIDESKPKYLSQTRFMSGRRIIKTSVTEITDKNVVDVLRKALATHELNRSEIDYLWKYYRGDQPIRNRVKDVRPEICNKITENRANEIVSFKVGYLCGEPIQYVSRNGGEEIVKQINTLNEYMFAEDKAAQDQELVEWQMICGTAFRLVLPDEPGEEDEAPFELYTLDPRDTFVVYSNEIGNKPLMAVKYSKDDNEIFHYSIYTENRYYLVDGDILVESKPHALDMIPIIEYPGNNARLGSFVCFRVELRSVVSSIESQTMIHILGVESSAHLLTLLHFPIHGTQLGFLRCLFDFDTLEIPLVINADRVVRVVRFHQLTSVNDMLCRRHGEVVLYEVLPGTEQSVHSAIDVLQFIHCV